VDARILLLKIQDDALASFKDEIIARDAENAALKEQTRVLKDARDTITKYESDSKAANDAIAKLDLDHAAKVAQINQDLADKQAQIAADEADKEAVLASDR